MHTDIIARPVKHNFATPPQHISYEQVYMSGNNIKFNRTANTMTKGKGKNNRNNGRQNITQKT
jgi:hypothetical protein